MCLRNFLSILCFMVDLSFGYVYAQNCGESMFFRPSCTYDKNRRLILSTLPSKVSSQDGYYGGSVGEGSERIYALGLCIPGTDPKVCSDCIETASVGLLQNCPNQTDSWDWRTDKTLCFVRYSNPSFFDQIDLNPSTTLYNRGVITENVTEFKSIWDDFMQNMIAAASASTRGMPARIHYAADISLPTPGFQRFYALMQCLPGITSVKCNACLQENVDVYKEHCSMNIGGRVLRPVCFFRWDLYPYLGAFDDIIPPPRPPPDGKPISTGIIVAIVVSSVLFVALVALGLFFWKRRQYRKIKLETDDDTQVYKSGANPESSSSDAITNADSLDRTFTNSPMDGKVKPPNMQVFVNFRGDQLRNNFVGYLVDALRRSEINVFIDNQEQRGEDLNTLFKRIEDSRIAIVVFSSRYTESEWCLNELVKIKERVQKRLLKVLPIFYKVTPGSVKRLKGEFGDNFRDKEYMYASNKYKIKRWREAIVFVSHMFALTFDEKSSALEIDFIENIVVEVMRMLQALPTVERGQSSRQPLPSGETQAEAQFLW